MNKLLKKVKANLLKNKVLKQLIEWGKALQLPGFESVPLYQVVHFFIQGIRQGSITTRASAISFKFFMALFPSLLFFFTIIPYIPVEGIHDTLLELIRDFMPPNAYQATEHTIKDIIGHKRGGLLSVGAFLTLYFASNGVKSIIDAFNKTIHMDEQQRSWYRQLTGLWMIFIVILIITLAVALLTFGTDLLNLLAKKEIIRSASVITAIQIGKYIVSAAIIFFCISFIYYIAPVKKYKFRLISAGSTMATLLSLITTMGFNYFVSNFASYNALYGSIGTLIVVMLFIYFNSIILLIGFELNASIRSASMQKKGLNIRKKDNSLAGKRY